MGKFGGILRTVALGVAIALLGSQLTYADALSNVAGQTQGVLGDWAKLIIGILEAFGAIILMALPIILYFAGSKMYENASRGGEQDPFKALLYKGGGMVAGALAVVFLYSIMNMGPLFLQKFAHSFITFWQNGNVDSLNNVVLQGNAGTVEKLFAMLFSGAKVFIYLGYIALAVLISKDALEAVNERVGQMESPAKTWAFRLMAISAGLIMLIVLSVIIGFTGLNIGDLLGNLASGNTGPLFAFPSAL